MLKFKKIELNDKTEFLKYTNLYNFVTCGYSFTELYAWKDYYNVMICFYEEALYIKMLHPKYNDPIFYLPICNDNFNKHIKNLENYCDLYNYNLIFTWLEDEFKDKLKNYSSNYIYENSIKNADYIYLRENLKTLSGKKLKNKRNFINQFQKKYFSHYSYESLNNNNITEIYDFLDKYNTKLAIEDEGTLEHESLVIKNFLDNYIYLDIKGGILKINNEVVAFTLGSVSSNMMIIHIEKGRYDISGSFQMINYLFINNSTPNDIKYINREQDLGILGIRKAKESYDPIKMGINYNAFPKKMSLITTLTSNDLEMVKKLWYQAFTLDNFSEYYFKYIYTTPTTYLYKVNDTVIAMASLFNFKTSLNQDINYLFALATRNTFQKQGIMSELLNHVPYKNTILILENNNLVPFYKKVGFDIRVRGYINTYTLDDNLDSSNLKFEILTQKDLEIIDQLYNQCYKVNVKRDVLYNDIFNLYEDYIYGCFHNGILVGYAFYDKSNNIITEVIVSNQNYIKHVLNYILNTNSLNKISYFNTFKGEEVYYASSGDVDLNLYVNMLYN